MTPGFGRRAPGYSHRRDTISELGAAGTKERRSGYVIMLLGSLLGLVVPVIHMSGKGVGAGSRIADTGGAFFFVWTLIAIGATALFSLILSVRGLWSLRKRP